MVYHKKASKIHLKPSRRLEKAEEILVTRRFFMSDTVCTYVNSGK
jgi:hypothetical protein